MRHRKKTIKLGRKTAHRESMLATLVGSLIEHGRVATTLEKAKAVRPLAERVVTLGKRGDLAARRLAIRRLGRSKPVVRLFSEIAPGFSERKGGYTRILKLGRRPSDSAERAVIEWVNFVPPEPREKPKEKGKEAPGRKSK